MAEHDADSPGRDTAGASHGTSPSDHKSPEARAGSDLSGGGLECARCGALLPEGDEGICAMCGMPFGFKTREMPILDEAYLAKMGLESPKKGAGAQSSQPFMPASQEIATRPKAGMPRRTKLLAIVVLLTTLVLLCVLLTVLITK